MELWWGAFIESKKYLSLRFTEDFCVMRMKNVGKFEEELTRQFKIDMINLMNFDPLHLKTTKISTLMGFFWKSVSGLS